MKQRGVWFGCTRVRPELPVLVKARNAKEALAYLLAAGERETMGHFRQYWSKVDSHPDAEALEDGAYVPSGWHLRDWKPLKRRVHEVQL